MNRQCKGKHFVAVALILTLLLPSLSGNVRFAFAENTSENGEYVTDVSGLEVWERVLLKKSVTLTEDVVITGEVKMEPGAEIYVNSGKLIVESQAVVQGDIYIEKSGLAELLAV